MKISEIHHAPLTHKSRLAKKPFFNISWVIKVLYLRCYYFQKSMLILLLNHLLLFLIYFRYKFLPSFRHFFSVLEIISQDLIFSSTPRFLMMLLDQFFCPKCTAYKCFLCDPLLIVTNNCCEHVHSIAFHKLQYQAQCCTLSEFP